MSKYKKYGKIKYNIPKEKKLTWNQKEKIF